jgi:hypothetical protein
LVSSQHLNWYVSWRGGAFVWIRTVTGAPQELGVLVAGH